MSKVVDNRIVKMSMDNSDLLKKATESFKALTNMDGLMKKIKGINVDTKGLQSVATDSDKAKSALERIAESSENLKSRFSIVGGIIANTVTGWAMRLGSAAKEWIGFGQGFEEYGAKMKAIQVIMSNTQGKSSIDDINKSLDALNTYADKTIYSFTDMTNSVSTFTAAGVSLNDATDAIQGLSNWAAASGTNATDLARAETQVSQALASGVVRLQDWNSVQNAGGLGGMKFQKALEDTAKSMGHGRDMTKSFRDSLQDGWLTSEVLLTTLRKFKDDKSMEQAATQAHTLGDALDAIKEAIGSGWSQIFGSIFGNAEESTQVWTALQNAISGVIATSFKAKTKLFDDWKAIGGRSDLIQGIANIWKTLTSVIGAVTKAFSKVFPPTTAMQLTSITTAFYYLTKAMIPSENTLKLIGDVAGGVFSVLRIGVQVVEVFVKAILSLIPTSKTGSMGLLELAAMVGRVVSTFLNMIDIVKIAEPVLDGIHTVVNIVWSAFGLLASGIVNVVDVISAFFIPIGKEIGKIVDDIVSYFDKWLNKGNDLIYGADGIYAKYHDVFNAIAKFITGVFDTMEDYSHNWGQAVANVMDAAEKLVASGFGAIHDQMSKWGDSIATVYESLADKAAKQFTSMKNAAVDWADSLKSSADKAKDATSSWGDKFHEGFDKAVEVLKAFKEWLPKSIGNAKEVFDKLATGFKKIATAAAPLFKYFKAKDLITLLGIGTAGGSLGKIEELSKNLTAFFQSLQKDTKMVSPTMLLAIGTALIEMAVAIKMIGDLDFDSTVKGIEMVAANMLIMVAAVKLMNKVNFKQSSKKLSLFMVAFGEAMKLMAEAMSTAGKLSPQQMLTSVTGLISVISAMVLAMNTMNESPKVDTEKTVQFVAMAGAMWLIGEALSKMGKLKPEQMLVAIAGMSIVFIELSKLAKTISGGGGNKGGIGIQFNMGMAANITAMGVAMLALAGGLWIIAKIPTDGLIRAVSTMGGVFAGLAIVGVALKKVKVNEILPNAAGLGIAIAAIAVSLKLLSTLSWEGILKGVTSLGVVLAELSIAMIAITKFGGEGGGDSGPALLIALGVAINMFTVPLMLLANVPMDHIGTALIALGGALGIVIAAAWGMQAASVGIGAFALAVGAIALAAFGVGAAMTGFALAMTVASGLTGAAINKIVKNFDIFIKNLTGILPDVGSFALELVKTLVDVLENSISTIAQAGLDLIMGLLASIDQNVYQAVTIAMDIITKLIDGLTQGLPTLVEAGVEFITTFIQSLSDSIRENSSEIVDAVSSAIEAILEIVVKALAKVVEVLFGWIPGVKGATKDLATKATDGMREAFDVDTVAKDKTAKFNAGVAAGADGATAAGKTLGDGAKNGSMTDLSGNGKGAGAGYVAGVSGYMGQAGNAGAGLSSNAKNRSKTDLSGNGKGAGSSYTGGIGQYHGEAGTTAAALASAAKKASKVSLHSEGSYAGEGFVNGLGDWIGKARDTAAKMVSGLTKNVKKILGINSPSKVMFGFGNFTGMGFVNGVENQVNKVWDAGANMATTIISAVKDKASDINGALDDTLNLQPTITPVVDTSQITGADLSGSFVSSAQLAASAYSQPQVVNETYTFGDMNFTITGTTQSTAQEVMGQVKAQFDGWLTEELRKVKKVN